MAEILNPHDADLESVILGACLAESTAMVLVSGKLCPEMFYEAKYGEIFAALLAMHRAGKAIDIITVRAELAARGKLGVRGRRLRTGSVCWPGWHRPPTWSIMRLSCAACISGAR